MDARSRTRSAYETGAHAYHARRLSRPRAWESVYAAELARSVPAGARVLALGSGTGEELEALEGAGLQATGLDLSRAMLDLARAAGHEGLVQADLCALPFPDASFDGAWSIAAFLHLERSELARAFSETARVIRPGGAFLLVTKQGSGEAWQENGGMAPRFFTFLGCEEACALAHAAAFQVIHCRIDSSDVPWIVLLARRVG